MNQREYCSNRRHLSFCAAEPATYFLPPRFARTPAMPTSARLMLITPLIGADTNLSSALSEALGAAEIAAVILRVEASTDERALLKALKPLVEAVQNAGAAALIEGASDLVGKSGADGMHALGERNGREATSRFKPEKLVGVGGLRTRDTAMAAGETGADYVLFGDPGKGGEAPPIEATLERLAWWAEIFVTPCVGQAETLEDVAPISGTGAEFVALGQFVWTQSPASAVRAAADALAKAEAIS